MALLSDHLEAMRSGSPDDNIVCLINQVLDNLQVATKLSGKANQNLLKMRRAALKLHISQEMRKICDGIEEDATQLFGDNLEDKLKKVQAENALSKALQRKSPNPKSQKLSNSKTHQKPWGGSDNKDGYQGYP